MESKLKIIFFADSHLGFDYPLRPRITMRRRGPDFFDNFHRILDYAQKIRPDMLIHGGDLFFRSRVPPAITDMVYSALYQFVNKTNIPLFIVPGNHERSRLPQSLFLSHPLIHIFDKPRHFFFNKNSISTALYGFPFFRGNIRDQFRVLLQQSGWQEDHSRLQLLVVHQAIEGAKVGPADFTFRKGKDVIDIKDIPADAVAVLSGHIHRRQVLFSGRVPVIYPGSIERTSFAEKDEQKGFYEIDFAREKKSWRVDRLKFLRLPARPMFDIHLEKKDSENDLHQSLLKQCADLPQGSVIRLKLQPSATGSFPSINMARIRSFLPASFSIQTGMQFQNS